MGVNGNINMLKFFYISKCIYTREMEQFYRTDDRYVTGGVRTSVTLCDRGEGGSKLVKKSVT